MGFKTATSSGRSIQIASNSVCPYRGPVAIDLFSSFIFTLSVTEIQLCKVNAHFSLDCTIFACNPCSILPIHNKFLITSLFRPFLLIKFYCGLGEWNTGCVQKWCNRARKCALTKLAVPNCFCLTQAVSLCGKIKRRRLLTLPDDRTKLTDPSEWLQNNLAPPTSPAVFKTARVRLFATHSHYL